MDEQRLWDFAAYLFPKQSGEGIMVTIRGSMSWDMVVEGGAMPVKGEAQQASQQPSQQQKKGFDSAALKELLGQMHGKDPLTSAVLSGVADAAEGQRKGAVNSRLATCCPDPDVCELLDYLSNALGVAIRLACQCDGGESGRGGAPTGQQSTGPAAGAR